MITDNNLQPLDALDQSPAVYDTSRSLIKVAQFKVKGKKNWHYIPAEVL